MFVPIKKKLIAMVALAIFAASGASAATVTSSAFAGGAAPGDPVCGSSPGSGQSSVPGSANAEYDSSGPGCNAVSSATAGEGYVSAISVAGGSGNGGRLSYATSRASATFTGSQLMFTPDEGYTDAILSDLYGDTIEITLFASFSGDTSADTTANTSVTTGSSGTIEASVRFGSALWQKAVSSAVVSDSGHITDSDTLAESISLSQNVNWGQGSTIIMGIGTRASVANVQSGAPAGAIANGSNTLSFNTNGPAFLLPEGFTVNAPELSIFDNVWVDPRITQPPIDDPDVVPLPAGLPLLLCALGTLGYFQRRSTS
ncbi:VPLPA-CTERM sorting domain-containing protein [uncultured Roseobacter sp.]|uniref:VPLPA-CTERM sorting domain-containing protein n=1 Tax=uncultured Roseobacter sp. TaxID=114847 RepID=UPI00262F026E|nr:VPLPA-CTERM sorting domain-containing protein [uncultured Roseobacter sp.]